MDAGCSRCSPNDGITLMTDSERIALAREAGMGVWIDAGFPIAAFARLVEARVREECAALLETAIAEGYRVPAIKADECLHGKFGWEDCIACYDEALLITVAAIR